MFLCPERMGLTVDAEDETLVFLQDCAWPKQCANVAAYPGQK
jgi:hypothetical protein